MMKSMGTTRRGVLSALAGGAALTGSSGTVSADDGGDPSRRAYTILPETEAATPMYTVDSGRSGPTAMILGGVHGDETAGYLAAERLADAGIDAGRFAAVPRANAVAIERESRSGVGGDLNRAFPVGGRPETRLARALWYVARVVDPDLVVDLHTSRGVFEREPEGVGQAVFHSRTGAAASRAADAAREVNRQFSLPERYEFRADPLDFHGAQEDLFVEKASRDLGANSYLAESYRGFPVETRVERLEAVGRELLDEAGLLTVP